MDIYIRYWDDNKKSVCTRYFSSAFLGHAKASDLLEAFLDATRGLILKRLLQIAMDGPNVNFKFLRDLENHLLFEQPPDTRIFLDMGLCGLHSAHNSFKFGEKGTNWNIVPFMRVCYNVFKDVPARRSDYLRYSGSSDMPLKFCAVRWLQNAAVAERCLKILSNLKKFVEGAKKKKLDIKSASYKTVCETLKDKFLLAKLTFFANIAQKTEVFLTEYQSDAPLAPFLYSDLTKLMTQLMELFVKKKCNVEKCKIGARSSL